MKKKKSNGMILITTMLFITIIVMIATLIAVQGKSALQNGNLSLQSEEAYLTALSGIEYVRGELRKNQTFGTSDFDSSTELLSPVNGFIVKYSGRNLTGYLGANSSTDYKSKFLISFNSPNQTVTTNENYKHTSSDCKYLSVNNLNTANPISQNISNGVRREVPAYSIYLVSKGVCGKAVRYAEAFLTSDGSVCIDGGSAIGGKINIKGSEKQNYTEGTKSEEYKDRNSLLTIKHVDSKYPGKLTAFNSDGKTTNDISLEGNGDIYDLLNLSNSVSLNSKLNNKLSLESPNDLYLKTLWSNLTLNQNATVDVDDLKSLTFEKVIKNISSELELASNTNSLTSNSDSVSVYNLKPGTYVYIREANTSTNEMAAYWKFVNNLNVDGAISNLNNSYSSYVTDIDSSLNGAISFGSHYDTADFQSRTVNLSGNVFSSGNLNFVVVNKTITGTTNTSNGDTPSEGGEDVNAKYELADSSVDFRVNGGSIITNGSLYINGEVVGNGNLIANHDIKFNAGSELEVDENQKVAVWAGGNVNIDRPINVSNDKLISLFNNKLKTDNEGGVGSSDSNISDNQLNRLIIGLTGDQAQHEIKIEEGQVPTDVITDEEFTESGYRFTYKDKTYRIFLDTKVNSGAAVLYEATSKERVETYIGQLDQTMVDYVYTWEEKIRVTDGAGRDTEQHHDDIYISYRFPKGQFRDTLDADFNIFIKDNDNYYYYKTIDFKSSQVLDYSDDTDLTPEQFEAKMGYTGKTIKFTDENSNYAGNISNYTVATEYNSVLSTAGTSSVKKEENIETAIVQSIANSKTSLRGTVYSKGNININIGNTDFDILGALITTGENSSGNLNINAAHISLIYDPNYVPFFKDASGVKTNVKFLSSFIGGEE